MNYKIRALSCNVHNDLYVLKEYGQNDFRIEYHKKGLNHLRSYLGSVIPKWFFVKPVKMNDRGKKDRRLSYVKDKFGVKIESISDSRHFVAEFVENHFFKADKKYTNVWEFLQQNSFKPYVDETIKPHVKLHEVQRLQEIMDTPESFHLDDVIAAFPEVEFKNLIGETMFSSVGTLHNYVEKGIDKGMVQRLCCSDVILITSTDTYVVEEKYVSEDNEEPWKQKHRAKKQLRMADRFLRHNFGVKPTLIYVESGAEPKWQHFTINEDKSIDVKLQSQWFE